MVAELPENMVDATLPEKLAWHKGYLAAREHLLPILVEASSAITDAMWEQPTSAPAVSGKIRKELEKR